MSIKSLRTLTLALALSAVSAALAPQAFAAGEGPVPPKQAWSFNGPFGTFDRGELQRGFQVYKEVCAACHSMNKLSYRHLASIGFSEAEVKAIARQYQVMDGPNDEGEMFERDAIPSDRFKAAYANEKAARAANNGALPPDLSLMAKARANGPDYLYALLTGYKDAPANFQMQAGMNYNEYFPGHQIAMANPLSEGGVTYTDGTNATVSQMARDVSAFLMWAAEPKMEERKSMGVKVMIFLFILAGLLIAARRRIWSDLH